MVEEDEVVIGGGAAAAIVPATAAVTQAVAPAAAISYACTVCASSETYDGNPIVMCDGALSVFWIIFCAMKTRPRSLRLRQRCASHQTYPQHVHAQA